MFSLTVLVRFVCELLRDVACVVCVLCVWFFLFDMFVCVVCGVLRCRMVCVVACVLVCVVVCSCVCACEINVFACFVSDVACDVVSCV